MIKTTKVIVALAAVLTLALLYLHRATNSRVREARAFVTVAPDIAAVRERYGDFSQRVTAFDELVGWNAQFPIEASPGDTLFVKSQEGVPYWVILLVSSDGSSIKSRYAGFYP